MQYITENERLGLRPMTFEDCADVVRWRNRDNVRIRYIYREKFTLEAEQAYFRREVETGNVYHWIVCDKGNEGRGVGCFVCNRLSRGKNELECGMFLGEPDAYGKGFARDTYRLASRWLLTHWTLGDPATAKLWSRAFTDNVPSNHMIRGAGFRLVEVLKDVECSDGTKADMNLYVLEAAPEAVRPAAGA